MGCGNGDRTRDMGGGEGTQIQGMGARNRGGGEPTVGGVRRAPAFGAAVWGWGEPNYVKPTLKGRPFGGDPGWGGRLMMRGVHNGEGDPESVREGR